MAAFYDRDTCRLSRTTERCGLRSATQQQMSNIQEPGTVSTGTASIS